MNGIKLILVAERLVLKAIAKALFLILLTVGVAAAQTNLLIVSGLGGEPRYVESFVAWGTSLALAAENRFGVPRANITYLAEDPSRNRTITGQSTKAQIEQALRAMSQRSGPDSKIMIVLIGHGAADRQGSRINLPGPDLTAEEFNSMLAIFPTQPTVVVNTSSASGDWQEELVAPNRTIITATRSGGERNETAFGEFFAKAFAEDVADPDKDGHVTIKEAFDYATAETTRYYQTRGTLQMEHARMEGNTQLATTFHLGTAGSAVPDNASPELRALFAQRQRQEESIELLRSRSGQMEAAAYQSELERLLLDLARTNRSIQQMQGGR
jgi:hypothetical protein